MSWAQYCEFASDDGEPKLLIVSIDLGYDDLRFSTSHSNYLWAINGPMDDLSYYGDCSQISKEKFIDRLRSYFPDCFEWLLFHPEWL